MKRILALLLSAALLMGAFAGCSQDGTEDPAASPSQVAEDLDASPSPSDGGEETTAPTRDYAAALASMPADTVMATVNGLDICWDELFYWLYSSITYLESGLGLGQVEDWSKAIVGDADAGEEVLTYSDFFINNSMISPIYYRTLESKAQELGITLDSDDETTLQEAWDAFVEDQGSQEEAEEYLASQYYNEDLYKYFLRGQLLREKLFVNQFGAGGANVSDEDVLDYVEDDGYMMAKQILLSTRDEDDNPISDEEKEEKLAIAQTVLNKLNAYEGDDFEGYFTELMEEYGEDPGVTLFPNGYLFQDGDMVEPFENAVKELEINECSEIVESDYGYHIILRLPINVDVIPSAYANYAYSGLNYSLRYLVAQEMFSSLVTEWQSASTVEETEALTNLNLGDLFGE